MTITDAWQHKKEKREEGMRTFIKPKVTNIVAFICYWTGADVLFYWLNRKAKRIVTFHNVLPDEWIKEVPSVGCMESVSAFTRILDIVAQRFSFSTNLNDSRSVTVTFDDGYLNQYEIAAEILRRKGIPAVLFMTGNLVGATPTESLVIDKILLWNQFAPDSAVEKVFGNVVPRDVLWMKYIQPSYREDWRNRGVRFLEKLESAYAIADILQKLPQEWVRLRFTGISKKQIDDLRSRGWKVGWHTKTHFPLGMLDAEGKRWELDSPDEYICECLSYPYGDIEAIGEESLSIASELGYPCALSNDPGYSIHRSNYFRQRFMLLDGNRYMVHFVLSGAKYFLKFGKLLPKADE